MGARRNASIVGSVAFASMLAPVRAQSIVRVDVANDGSETQGAVTGLDVSDDGSKVAFASFVDGLDPADVNHFSDVFVRDLNEGTTKLVSVRSNGNLGNDRSWRPRISADGRFVAFESDATNLVGGDRNGVTDVFVHELATGATMRVSVASDGSEANGYSEIDGISADGNLVLFSSVATNLVPDDHNGVVDVFLRDVAAGTTVRVSTALDGTEADGATYYGSLSRDGTIVMLSSFATNFVPDDTNGWLDVFVRDLAAGTLVRASVDSSEAQLEEGGGNYSFKVEQFGNELAPDGRFVAFSTSQHDLFAGDDNSTFDVFLRDLVAGTTTIQSVDSDGAVSAPDSIQYDIGTFATGISADGRYVLMAGAAKTLAPDGYSCHDIYVRDRDLSMTTRQSNGPSGHAGNGISYGSRMSADGAHVVFVSQATDLIEGHATSGQCAFLVNRPLRPASAESYGSGLAGALGTPALTAATLPYLNLSCDVDLTNSSTQWTVALLFLGTGTADLPTRLGGDLLVAAQWTQLVVVSPYGASLVARLPHDERLAATDLHLQALELDAGAIHGVSFTAGLTLHPGF